MMESKNRLKASGGHRILQGANLILYTVIVIAIVGVVNWFVKNHDKRWDLTPNQQYSLSAQSKKLVKGLKHNVTIYVFDRKDAFRNRRDLLDEYVAASDHVKVDYVDPDRQPALARQFNVRNYGTIVVTSGNRHMEAQTSTEEGVTAALIRVLKGQKTVCFIQGHGERDLDGSDRLGYQQVKKELGNENYQVKTLVLLQKNEIPDDCGMVVIAGPKNDYLPPEIETIRKYVEDGGRLLVMLDAGRDLPNLEKLLPDWGVTVRNDLVVDLNPVAQLFGTTPDMPLIIKYGSSPIAKPLKNTATLFPITRSFDIARSSQSGATDQSLAETSADSFGVIGYNPKMRQVSFRPGKDIKGPLDVAVTGTIPVEGKKDIEGRLVVFGTSFIASNAYLGFQGNRDFVMNAVNWLTAEEELISIRPKSPTTQHLDLNQRQMAVLRFLGIIGLPLMIILIGGAVWWRRR